MRSSHRLVPFTLASIIVGCGEGRLVSTFEESFPVDEVRELQLDHGAGDLLVVGESDRRDVAVLAELRTHRSSELGDGRAERAVRLDVRPLGEGSAQIVARLHDPPPGYTLDVTAVVPEPVAMRIDDGSGDVAIEGIGGLELSDGSGDVQIEHVAGGVTVNDGTGDVTVRGVDGSVEIHDGSGDVRVHNVGGDAYVRDGSGDLSVIGVGGHVRVHDGSGDIFVRDAADVTLEADGSGDVHIE